MPDTMTACNTVDQCLRAGEARLTAVSETPRLDAEVLLAHALNWPRSRLYAYPEHTLAPDQRRQWQQRLNKRLAGIPVAYLCEHAEFWSLPLRVTPATLIPRPETEGLVEWALALGPSGAERRVADLGTGSGAIALALAKERSDWQFTAVDISTEALNIAQAQLHRIVPSYVKRFGAVGPELTHSFYSGPLVPTPGRASLGPHRIQSSLRSRRGPAPGGFASRTGNGVVRRARRAAMHPQHRRRRIPLSDS